MWQLFCAAFPVKTEGAFSAQPVEAQTVTGCPFLCELLPDVLGQKAVLSTQLLRTMCYPGLSVGPGE